MGDARKAQKILGWKPRVDFQALIDMMIAADIELARQVKALADAGFECNGNNRIS